MSTRSALKVRMRETVAAAILDAAEAVAGERGIEGTAVAAIAARAGVAVGTIYNYFPDRDAIFTSLFAARRAVILPRIVDAAAAARGLPAEAGLRAFVRAVLEVFEAHRAYLRVAATDDAAAVRARGKQRPVLVVVTETLAELLAPLAGAAADDVAHMMFGALKALLVRRLAAGAPLAPDADLVVDAFLRGVRPRAAR